MAYIAKKIGYISEKQFSDIYNMSEEISKMLSGFIKKL